MFKIILIVIAALVILFFVSYVLFGFNIFKIPKHINSKIVNMFAKISKIIVIILISLFFILPIWIVIAASFTDSVAFAQNGYSFFIPKFSLTGYQYIFNNKDILRGLLNSVLFTVIVTIASLIVNTLAAYALSEKKMPGNKIFNKIFVFTMLFSTGMVPIVLVMRQIGMYNKVTALIIPAIINVYNILLIRNYMYSIPQSLKEAAQIDGAGYLRTFFKVILPASVPIIATTGLMAFVLKWNSYMDILYYLEPGEANKQLWTIQYVIMDMLMNFEPSNEEFGILNKYVIQSGTIIITMIPLLIAFPFVQKYFEKGLTLGSVKE